MRLALVTGFIMLAQSVCYLESANAECPVCWATRYADNNDTVGVTKMAPCPSTLDVVWVQKPPTTFIENTNYKVSWSIDTSAFTVSIKDDHIPHANIHSCLRDVGACTPFVANTPGLATHTSAITKTMTKGQATFESSVNLELGKYTIIAHTRLFIEDRGSKPTKLDVAIGCSRTVVEKKIEVTASSITSTVIGGTVIFLGALAVMVALKKAKVNSDKAIASLMHGPISGLITLLLGLSDAIAFTFTVINMINFPTKTTVQLIPVCILLLCVSWILSLTKFVDDFRKHYAKYLLEDERKDKALITSVATKNFGRWTDKAQAKLKVQGNYLGSMSEEERPQSYDRSVKAIVESLSKKMDEDEAIVEDGKVLAALSLDIRNFHHIFIMIIFESVPIIVVSIYFMATSGSATTAEVLTLFFASLSLGSQGRRLVGMKAMVRERDQILGQFFEMHSKEEQLQLQVVQRLTSPKGSRKVQVLPDQSAPRRLSPIENA